MCVLGLFSFKSCCFGHQAHPALRRLRGSSSFFLVCLAGVCQQDIRGMVLYQTGDIPARSMELPTVPPVPAHPWSRAADPGRKASGIGFSPPLNVELGAPAPVQGLRQGYPQLLSGEKPLHECPSFQEESGPRAWLQWLSRLTTGCHCNSRREEASLAGLGRGHAGRARLSSRWWAMVFPCLQPEVVKCPLLPCLESSWNSREHFSLSPVLSMH